MIEWINLISKDSINNFSTILLSIVLEGFPFIIIGALVSSFIQIFISEDFITKNLPKGKLKGLLLMASLGLIFPICECGIIPVARRLIKKGVPVSLAVTFMLAVPIINPVVLMSTYYAFLGTPSIVIMRAIVGIISAITIGYLIGELHDKEVFKKAKVNYNGKNLKTVKINKVKIHNHDSQCDCNLCTTSNIRKDILEQLIKHSSYELYDIGRFFIIGAILSAIMQTYIPKSYIMSVAQGAVSSTLTMMAIAFLLSVCSETDAFIARTFAAQFTKGSVLGFLIFGPMVDLKNTIMLTGTFNFKFVVKLLFLIFSICFLMAILSNYIPFFQI